TMSTNAVEDPKADKFELSSSAEPSPNKLKPMVWAARGAKTGAMSWQAAEMTNTAPIISPLVRVPESVRTDSAIEGSSARKIRKNSKSRMLVMPLRVKFQNIGSATEGRVGRQRRRVNEKCISSRKARTTLRTSKPTHKMNADIVAPSSSVVTGPVKIVPGRAP